MADAARDIEDLIELMSRLPGLGPRSARRAVLSLLKKRYPRATTALHWKDPFQLLVATILSAQSTDVRVNQVTPPLFEKYPTPGDFAGADLGQLQQEIYTTGFFRQKERSILMSSLTRSPRSVRRRGKTQKSCWI